MNDYSDRFDRKKYEDDEPYQFGSTSSISAGANVLYIPESIWHRIVSLGRAYRLHYLELLSGMDDIHLNRNQCGSLSEEFKFLSSFITDPLLLEYSDMIVKSLDRFIISTEPDDYTIEGP